MSRIDDLPADRRAVLQLLLKQGKSYDDLAALLRIEPDAVRERARDALDQLGPEDPAGLSQPDQDQIADYLLGQQGASRRADTRALLERSAPGRAWARTVSGELRAGGMDGGGLPDIPADGAEVDEAFDALEARRGARQRQARSSRLGGVLLLAAIGLAVAFLIIVLVSSGSDDNSGTAGSSSSSPAATGSTTATTPTAGSPQVLGQANLKAPAGAGDSALAAVTLVKQGEETDILFQAQAVPANHTGDAYALWLTGGTGRTTRLGFTPRVKANGKLRFASALSSNVDVTRYTTMELTRETTATPKSPGPVVMSGPLRLAH